MQRLDLSAGKAASVQAVAAVAAVLLAGPVVVVVMALSLCGAGKICL
jgi:hypothetical protein